MRKALQGASGQETACTIDGNHRRFVGLESQCFFLTDNIREQTRGENTWGKNIWEQMMWYQHPCGCMGKAMGNIAALKMICYGVMPSRRVTILSSLVRSVPLAFSRDHGWLRWSFVLMTLVLVLLYSSSAQAGKKQRAQSRSYASHAVAQRFVDAMVQEHGVDKKWLQQTLQSATFNRRVQRLMRPAGSGGKKRYGNWERYRGQFLVSQRINAGRAFMRENNAVLERAQRHFGVPASVIVGIIGVETGYGQNMGNFSVLNALATLAFDFPATPQRDRSAYFQSELEQFLLQHYAAGSSPQTTYGSYAGAVGYGQFMPSSIARYAVDFDGDGRINLDTAADAIGSVANYLRGHGWVSGLPAYYPAYFEATPHRETTNMVTLLAPDIVPTFDVAQLLVLGVRPDAQARQYQGQFALVELFNGDPSVAQNRPHYVLGTQNFYVVTRYNRSSYYALAVLELGEAVRAAYASDLEKRQ